MERPKSADMCNYDSENIYENICEDCGRLFDETCPFCFDIQSIYEEVGSKRPPARLLPKLLVNLLKRPPKKPSFKRLRMSKLDISEPIPIPKEPKAETQEVHYENVGSRHAPSVDCWLEGLMTRTEDYEDGLYVSVKCIPSKTFTCCAHVDTFCTPETRALGLYDTLAGRRAVSGPEVTIRLREPETLVTSPAVSWTDKRRRGQRSVPEALSFSMKAPKPSQVVSISLNTVVLTYDKVLESYLHHIFEPSRDEFLHLLELVWQSTTTLTNAIVDEETSHYQALWQCNTSVSESSYQQQSLESPWREAFEFEPSDGFQWERATDDFQPAFDLAEIVDVTRYLSSFQSFVGREKMTANTYTKVDIYFSDESPEVNQFVYPGELMLAKPKKEPFLLKPPPHRRKRSITNRNEPLKITQSIHSWMETLKHDMEDEEDVIIVIEKAGSLKKSKSKSRLRSPSPGVTKKERYKVNLDAPVPKKRAKAERLQLNSERYTRRLSVQITSPLPCEELTSPLKKASSLGNLAEASLSESTTTLNTKDEGSFTSRMKFKLKSMFNKGVKIEFPSAENQVFGNSIDRIDVEDDVPIFVKKCVELLEPEEVISTPGLYRASGNKTVMDDVRKKINQGSSKNKRFNCLKDQEVNNLTGILKQFFREMEEPLIPEATVLKSLENVDAPNFPQLFRGYLEDMPVRLKQTLKFLICHLREVTRFALVNKMDSNNLSIVWGPCVFKAIDTVEAIQNGTIVKINQVLKELIDHYQVIFE